jgi:hypothetical protein
MNRMPQFYVAPMMFPLYWGDEQSGELPAAVRAYFDECLDGVRMTPEQLEMVIEYCQYFIEAPCWVAGAGEPGQLDRLRLTAKLLKTVEDVRRWTSECLELGLDPF